MDKVREVWILGEGPHARRSYGFAPRYPNRPLGAKGPLWPIGRHGGKSARFEGLRPESFSIPTLIQARIADPPDFRCALVFTPPVHLAISPGSNPGHGKIKIATKRTPH